MEDQEPCIKNQEERRLQNYGDNNDHYLRGEVRGTGHFCQDR